MPNAALQAGAGAAEEEVPTKRKVTPQLLVHDLAWLLLRIGNPLQLSLLRSPADSASCAPLQLARLLRYQEKQQLGPKKSKNKPT